MKKLKGLKIQEGLASGKVFKLKENIDIVSHIKTKNIQGEIDLFRLGLSDYQKELDALIKKCKTTPEREVLSAHLLFTKDESLISEIESKIEDGFTAIYATNLIFSNYIDIINANTKLEDSRAADFLDVKRGIINKLIKEEKINFPNEDFIIVTEEILPSAISKYRTKHLKGVITKKGGEMSHAAIILRSLLIPYLSGVNITNLNDNEFIILDALKGEVIKEPSKTRLDQLKKELKTPKKEETISKCQLKSGEDINLMIDLFNLNQLNNLKEIPPVGLYRSEIFFIAQKKLPTKKEQEKLYYSILEKVYPKGAVIRLLDLSSDKTLPYLKETLSQDEIGIRVINNNPNIFKTQIEALISAYNNFNKGELHILIPMVSMRSEVLQVRKLILDTINKINPDIDKSKIMLGVMVEIPVTCFEVSNYLDLVDFISIGTNDLIKSFFAISRNNETYNYDLSYYNPAFLNLLKDVKEKVDKENVLINICGSMPSNFRAALTLIALGFTNLTIPQGIRERFKKTLSKINLDDLKEILNDYLTNNDLNNYLERLKGLY